MDSARDVSAPSFTFIAQQAVVELTPRLEAPAEWLVLQSAGAPLKK